MPSSDIAKKVAQYRASQGAKSARGTAPANTGVEKARMRIRRAQCAVISVNAVERAERGYNISRGSNETRIDTAMAMQALAADIVRCATFHMRHRGRITLTRHDIQVGYRAVTGRTYAGLGATMLPSGNPKRSAAK